MYSCKITIDKYILLRIFVFIKNINDLPGMNIVCIHDARYS